MTTNIKPSWRALIDAKIIKRTDNGMAVRPHAIRVLEGFNLRDTTAADYRDDIEALKGHIRRGGQVPALEVVLSADGQGVDLVDGHRRTTSYLELIAEGHMVEWIRIEPFNGNDVERVARIMTSNEGRKLRPLEIAEGYKRLAAFGLTPDDIARRVVKTRQHVDQMLILANAPHSVQHMVATGTVSATLAVQTVRTHGEKAKHILADAQVGAAAQGRRKVTAATVKPWTPPAKVVAPALDAVESLLDSLPIDVLKKVEIADKHVVGMVEVSATELLDVFKALNAIKDAKKAAEEKQRGKAAKAAQGELVEGGA